MRVASQEEAEERGMGCSQEVGRMPETVISADVTSVVVHEEYSACQRDICSGHLDFRGFFFFPALAVMDSCFLYLLSVSQPICLCPPVQWRNRAPGNIFEFLSSVHVLRVLVNAVVTHDGFSCHCSFTHGLGVV